VPSLSIHLLPDIRKDPMPAGHAQSGRQYRKAFTDKGSFKCSENICQQGQQWCGGRVMRHHDRGSAILKIVEDQLQNWDQAQPRSISPCVAGFLKGPGNARGKKSEIDQGLNHHVKGDPGANVGAAPFLPGKSGLRQ